MLSQAARDALDRDGYVVITDAIDGASLTELELAFDEAPTQADGTQHVSLAPDVPGYATWAALKEHPVTVAAARHILLAPFHVRDLHGRNPLPGYGLQGLHSDFPVRAPGAPYFVVSALFMIDDFSAENGATRVVPGSHLFTRAIPKKLAQPRAHHPEETIITGTRGSVLVFNGHLWHSGRTNHSRGPRRAAQMVLTRSTA
jgi:ectoine hydroxylase-related dioxygenase (phytanoyl-CoA dioxygenase family)